MVAELSSLEKTKAIRSEFVDRFVRDILPNFPNKIRAINQCVNQLKEKLTREKLDPETFPLPATIGDIDPWRLGFNRNNEPDPFEERYQNLSDKLALDPDGPNFLKLQANDREIRRRYKQRGIALTRYNPQGGKGTEEVRNIVVEEAWQIGLKASSDQVWMGYGGGDLIERAARSVNVYFVQNFSRSAILLAPSVGFSMAVEAIKDDQVNVKYLDNSDLPRNELTAERLAKYMEEDGSIPDMVLLTPANNPNAQSYDPENLRGFIN